LREQAEVQYITERYRALPGDEGSAVLFLDNLLLAQDRLAEAEFGFATAEVTYNLALINLKRAQGTLLQSERVEQIRMYDNQLPALILDSGGSRPEPLPGNAPLPLSP
jgi:outer membrane protein